LPVRAPITSFIGRERELAAIKRLLAQTRLLTLSGPPGTGKTRLALAVAAGANSQFTDGVTIVPLAPVTDPALVAATIAQALGARELRGRPLLESLRGHLHTRHFLLVLDNFEQVLPAATLVTDLLTSCPKLTVLVTSRALLQLQGEQTFAVPPLTLPARESRPTLETALQSEAVQLFVDRARATRHDFVLTEQDAAAVAEVCHRLEGLPLAIELAAARVRLLPPRTLLARLAGAGRAGSLAEPTPSPLHLLTGGPQDVPARQRTLHGAIIWSYGLLTTPERRLFNRLSVFSGGWTLEAAEASCAGDGLAVADVLQVLTQLVEKSLVHVEQPPVDDRPEARFRVLELLREFGRERLLVSGEADLVRTRHAEYYLLLAEQAASESSRLGWAVRLERLGHAYENVRAALAWYVDRGEAARGLRLAGAMWSYWLFRGPASEGWQWIDRLLHLPGADAPTRERAKALRAAGLLAQARGDDLAARALLAESLDVAREVDDRPGVADALSALGNMARMEGGYATARSYLEEAVAIRRGLGPPERAHLGSALCLLGMVAFAEGGGEAVSLLEEGLAIGREYGDVLTVSSALNGLIEAAMAKGDYEAARSRLAESLHIRQEMRDQWTVAWDLELGATLAAIKEQPERAIRLASAAAAVRAASGTPLPVVEETRLQARLAPAYRALSESAAATAWAEGQAMSLDQAIAYALGAENAASLDRGAPIPAGVGRDSASLTPREREVASLLAQGLSDREIAAALVISERTAQTHVANILSKVGLRSRTQIAAWVHNHRQQAEPARRG